MNILQGCDKVVTRLYGCIIVDIVYIVHFLMLLP